MVNKIAAVDSGTLLFTNTDVQAAFDSRTLAIVLANIPATSPLQGLLIGNGSATIPVRPTTTLPVIFNTTSYVPTTGTTAGGEQKMVAGLDVWLGAFGSSGGGAFYVQENPLGSGTYPNRPATSTRVTWSGVVAPAGGGTSAGGTPLMLNGTDAWEAQTLG